MPEASTNVAVANSSAEVGPKYGLTEGYTGMVYYGNYGDVTGDGRPPIW